MTTSLDWIKLGYIHGNSNEEGRDGDSVKKETVFYHKKEFFMMNSTWIQQVDIQNDLIACAPFGGPVAVTINQKQELLKNGQLRPNQVISIYTSSGRLLRKFNWFEGELLVYMGWDSRESLVCVTNSGNIYIYTVFGKLVAHVDGKMLQVNKNPILACKMYSKGIVILSKNERSIELHIVTHLYTENPDVQKLHNVLVDKEPVDNEDFDDGSIFALEIIEKVNAVNDADVDVILGLPTYPTLFIINMKTCIDMGLENGPFRYIAKQSNGLYIACLNHVNNLWVVKSDFTDNDHEIATQAVIPPDDIAWCGVDSICCYWSPATLKKPNTSLVLLIGPTREYIKFIYEGPVQMVSEVDGVRILTTNSCEFLQRVPESLHNVFCFGSLHPGATLMECHEQLLESKSMSIKPLRNMNQKQLVRAVKTCLEAAGHELDQWQQNKLLNAVVMGKKMPKSKDFPHNEFYEMVKHLRVLNAIRDPKVGIPLTITQYKGHFTPQLLIDRLTARFEHRLAIEICKYLNLNDGRVVLHWACAKVCSDLDNETIINAIRQKMNQRNDISFAVVAMTAYRVGKTDLARVLLDLEQNPSEKVSVLLTMGENVLAMQVAEKAMETDLMYMVIIQLMNSVQEETFYDQLSNTKLASQLFETYAVQTDSNREKLRGLLKSQQRSVDEAKLYFMESFKEDDIENCIEKIKHGGKLIKYVRNNYPHKQDVHNARIQIALIRYQVEMDKIVNRSFFYGMSIADTIYHAVYIGEPEKLMDYVDSLIVELEVDPRRCWWIKCRALSKAKKWSDLETFCSSLGENERPLIGYVPFAEYCIQEGAFDEAQKYIVKVDDVETKIQLYLTVNNYGEAINLAFAEHSKEFLNMIYGTTTNMTIRKEIENRIDLLS